MKSIYIPEHHIRNLFHSLTLNDDSRTVLNNLVLKFDYSYSKFMYMIFSAYANMYVSVLDEHSRLTQQEVKRAMNKLSVLRREINVNNVYVADKYDMLYGITCTGTIGNMRFKDYLYEDMYSRLENLLGVAYATNYLEDIFDSIECITTLIESNLISVSEDPEDVDGNIIFYLDIQQEGLLFIII